MANEGDPVSDPDPSRPLPPAGGGEGNREGNQALTAAGESTGPKMAVYVVNLCLLRFALPLSLAAGHASRFIKAVLVLSLAISIAQLVFQITLLSLPPYGSFLINCDGLEQSLRHLGLVRLNGISAKGGVCLLLPDVLVVLASFATHLVFSKLLEPAHSASGSRADYSQFGGGAFFGPKFVHFLGALGKYVVLAALCLAGAARPSVPGAIYYVSFIFWATQWAWQRNLGKAFAYTCQMALAPLVAVHLLVLFAYQTQWPQSLFPPEHQIARLLGVTALMQTSCDDPRSVTMSPNMEWSSFANPFLLLFLYFSLVFESQILLSPSFSSHGGRDGVPPTLSPPQGGQVSWNGAVRGGVGAAASLPPSSPPRSSHPNPTSGLSRRRTIPWSRAASIRVRGRHVVEIAELNREENGEDKMEPAIGNTHLGDIDEDTPLMHSGRVGRVGGARKGPGAKYRATGTSVRLKKGDVSSLTQDATGSVIWAHAPGPDSTELELDKNPEEIHLQQLENANTGIEDIEMDSGPLEQVVDAVISIFQIITRSSYIATNIIMMAWSITYHSWLTFVLLLWASVLWMIPNQRRSLLRCSPFLVAYAEVLLVAQYVYGMNLTDEELPPAIEGINLAQIGLVKYNYFPFKPIIVKSLYTVMFWITLRQYSQERWELRNAASAVVGVTAEPFVISVTTATSQEIPPENANDINLNGEGGVETLMHRFGAFLKSFLTKFWIWVVAIMLCVIGLGGAQVVVYRIVYMALFLIFVLTFQLSYAAWRKMMYGFWLTVIVYSMLCLVLIYTYQFDNFPAYWQNYTGIPVELQHDIGLEVFDTGALFVRLLTPTFFVIITVIQLHYFHKDFLAISDIRHRNQGPPEVSTSAPEEDDGIFKKNIRLPINTSYKESIARRDSQKHKNHLSLKDVRNISYATFVKMTESSRILVTEMIELLWRFFEIHMVKIVFLSFVLMAVYDVCALHLAFVVLSVAALPCGKRVQGFIIHFSSALTSVLLLSKMIYQIEYIRHEQWEANCTGLQSLNSTSNYVGNVEFTMNNADWIGFKKTAHLPDLLKGYIGLILVCTLNAVVCTRQKHVRRALGVGPTPPTTPVSSASQESTSYWARQQRNILFPGVDRQVADNDISTCVKFMFNYGFYKFGVEICLITTVAVIGTRMDVYSIVYSIWLCRLVHLSGRMGRGPKGAGSTGWGGGREALARVWLCFLITIAILLPVQYVLAVGLPPGLCVDFPWYLDERLRRLQEWMFLPDYVHAPRAYKLVCDFILLLMVCQQHTVFKAERGPNSIAHPGGSNRETSLDVDDPGLNPVPDFISEVRSWLDVVKRVVLSSFFWISLAVVFLAGTNRVNLFALGYLAGSFIFLWQGNDFYLRPMNTILSWWNTLLGYNVAVILCKSFIQMVGCVFIQDLQKSACWLVQLLGIACIKKFRDETSLAGVSDPKHCVVPREDTGLAWDGVCFAFLLLQRRLFRSHYFLRVVDETKAQTILASRGAELIEELSKRQIREQQDLEHQVLEKIKHKMERIKATHQRRQETFFREPASHFDAQPSSRLSSPSLCPSHVKVTAATDAGPNSPQGFHTPIEDDGTDTAPPSPTPSVSPSHPPRPIPMIPSQPFGGLPVPPSHRRSLSQTMQVQAATTTTTTNTSGAPTPSSAAFTISLDGYLEGQRISISSPLSSDIVLPLSVTPRRRQASRRCMRPRPASFPPPPNDLDYYGGEEDDESFPVFSPPPYDAIGMDVPHHGTGTSSCAGPRDGHTSRGSRGAGGSVSNPPIGPPWLPPLASLTPGHSFSISPAQSHHTCEQLGEEFMRWHQRRYGIRSSRDAVRSGDYFMFEEYDDDEEEEILGLKQSKKSMEEEEEEDDEDVVDCDNATKAQRRRRFTLSKLLSSAMKTDVEQAADMALMSHQDFTADGEGSQKDEGLGEDAGDEATGSSWRKSSLGVASEGALLPRHRSHSGVRSRRSSSLSARSEHALQQPSSSVSVRSSFQSSRIPPLSEEEEPQVGSASSSSTPTHGRIPSAVTHPAGKDEPPGRGRETRQPEDPGDGDPDGEPVSATSDGEGARRIWAYMKFVWALIESLMVSGTHWLNRFSRDYRYIARCLTREKRLLKEKSDFREGMRTGSSMIWQPRPIVVASWKTRSSEFQGIAEKKSSEGRAYQEEKLRSKKLVEKDGPIEMDWDSDDNVNEERQRNSSETEEEFENEGNMVPKIRIWAASLEKGLDPRSEGGSPALVSLEALEAEDMRKEEGPHEESTAFGGQRSPAACLLLALWYAVISHSELVCYFTVFLHQIKSASLLSIPLPLMVFLWGTLSVPRPSKTFWVTIIAYTEVMVMIKCMFQFDYLPWNQQAIPENLPFFPPRIIGIERKKRYAVFDLTLLLVVFFHRFMLKSLGLWKTSVTHEDSCSLAGDGGVTPSMTESPSKSTADAHQKSSSDSVGALEKATLSEADTEGPTPQCANLVVVRIKVQENIKHFPHVASLAASKYLSSIKAFMIQLLEPTTRVTADVYAYMFMCDFFNIMVVIFGFASFGTQQGDGGVTAYIEENKVPMPFLVMLILQFALMVIDRALFLRKYILGKILFQAVLVVGVHIWMFIVLPGVTERQFNAALPPQMWYVVKCLYLLLSAYQIRSGYPTRILGNFLCKKYNYINMFLFKGFMAVPFLFELRALMDWIWTDTSMTLSDWLKLEDIFAHIFQLKCQRRVEKEYPQPRGQKKTPLVKYLIGGGFLLGIIAIIWFPLVLFALGSTVGEANLPYDVSLELRVGAYQPVFRMSAQNNTLIWFSERNWNSFGSVYKKDRVAQTFLSNYDYEDVAVAKLSGSSTATWTVSPPAKSQMIHEVLSEKPMLVTLTWSISRKAPNQDTSGVATESRTITMEANVRMEMGDKLVTMRNPMRDHLAAMLSGNESVPAVILPKLLPKFIKVVNKGKATAVTQLMRRTASDHDDWWGTNSDGDGYVEGSEYRDVTLKLQHGSYQPNSTQVEWWEIGELCLDRVFDAILSHLPYHDPVNQTTGECDYLTIFTFNDKAFPGGLILSFLSGAGIMGLYTSMVILVSKYLRGYFTGIAEEIMFEDMPNVDRILQLCLDIYLVRESGELDLEEDLFAKLVFLYRSPETLIKWTRPKGEAIEAPPRPEGPSPGGGGSGSGASIARRARPEEDDDDDDDPDDDPDDAAALVLMDDSGAVAPRAQPERS